MAIDGIVQGIILSFFIRSLWNLQITWADKEPHMWSKFGQSELFTVELPNLIAEKTIFDLLGMLNSGEQSFPFGANLENILVCCLSTFLPPTQSFFWGGLFFLCV